METKATSTGHTSKTFFLGIIVLVLLLNPISFLRAQTEKALSLYSFENKTELEYDLTSLTCKNVEGNVYIMWTVREPSDDCAYVLEKSEDDMNYYKIYSVKGIKSPRNMELLNSFIDKLPSLGTSYYRVRRLTQDNNIVSRSYILNGMDIQSDFTSAVSNNEDLANVNSTYPSFYK